MRVLLLTAALLVLPATAPAAEEREFSVNIPAAGLELFELDAKVGEIEITAADIDHVELHVTLEPDDEDWFGSSERLKKRLESAELEHAVNGKVLRARLDYDESDSGDDDLEEHWEIRLPAALALETVLNVGSLRVEGTRGGVSAEVNVGELTIDVLAGEIDARVNVGEIDIRTRTASAGEIALETNIGDTRLRIDGKSAGSTQGWLGKNLTHDSGGDDDIEARVNVGEVSVQVR